MKEKMFGQFKPSLTLPKEMAGAPVYPPAITRLYCDKCGLITMVKPKLLILICLVIERNTPGLKIEIEGIDWTKNYILGHECFQCAKEPWDFHVQEY